MRQLIMRHLIFVRLIMLVMMLAPARITHFCFRSDGNGLNKINRRCARSWPCGNNRESGSRTTRLNNRYRMIYIRLRRRNRL